jgi:hypothetical protein
MIKVNLYNPVTYLYANYSIHPQNFLDNQTSHLNQNFYLHDYTQNYIFH